MRLTVALLCSTFLLVYALSPLACEGERAHPIDLEQTEQPVFLLLEQRDLDVTLEVHTKTGVWLVNSPSGTNGYEFVYIPDGPTELFLCARPTFESTQYGGWEVQILPANGLPLEDIESLIQLSKAGELWATADPELRQLSLELYVDIAQSSSFWASTAMVYATRGLIARLQEIRAQELLSRYQKPLRGPLAYQKSLLLGHIAANNDSYNHSLAYLYRAKLEAEAWSKESDRSVDKDLSLIWNLIAEGHISLRQFKLAEAALVQALQLADGSALLSAEALNHRGYYYIMLAKADPQNKQQHLKKSLLIHGEAEQLAITSKDPELLAIIYNNMGTIYRSLGDYSNSRRHLARALEQTRRVDAAAVKPYIRRNLGKDAASLGDVDQAIAYLGAALEGFSRGQLHAADDAICRLGSAARLRGDFEQAKRFRERCFKSGSEASENASYLVYSRLEEAISAHQLGEAASARESIDEAYALLTPRIQSELHAKVITYHALLSHTDDRAMALAEFERAKDMVVYASNTVCVELLGVELEYWLTTHDIERALATAEDLIAEIERVHSAIIDTERLGPAWTAMNHDRVVALVEYLLSPDLAFPAEKTLYLLERVRAISLRKAIANSRGTDATDDMRLRRVSQMARESSGPESGLNTDLAEFEARELLRTTKRGSQQVTDLPPVPNLEQIQSALSEQQRVLYYFMGAKKVHRFDITRNAFDVSDIGDRQEIDALIASVRHELASPGNTVKSQSDLASLILPPYPDGSGHWIIVPHKSMHELPFAALSDSTTGKPAILSVSMSVAPSLAALLLPKPDISLALDGRADLAILADPVFSGGDQELILKPTNSESDLRGWADDLRRLPMTATEASNLVEQFANRTVLSYTGPRASRATLATARVRNARILHLATHGYFGESSTFSTGIALSVVNEQQEPDPGFVTVAELSEFKFNNRLVVINGCETALGVARAGEGLVGMTRAFLTQGVHHVISTLWPVSDRASAMFVKYFYTYLAQTHRVSEALRRAQLDLRRTPRYRDPFFWAPYVLSSVDLDDSVAI